MSWGQGALLTGWTIRWLGLDGGLLLGVLNYLAQSALFAATGTLPRYRRHLGCILLKMPGGTLLKGAGRVFMLSTPSFLFVS